MMTTVGIVREADEPSGSSAAITLPALDPWPRPPAGEVLFSPPAPVSELGRRASLIVRHPACAARRVRSLSSLRGGHRHGDRSCLHVPVGVSDGLCAVPWGPGRLSSGRSSLWGPSPARGVAALAPEPGTDAEVVEAGRGNPWPGLATWRWWRGSARRRRRVDSRRAAGFIVRRAGGSARKGRCATGCPRETARSFVRQTALATALLLRDHAGSPADLKDQVASPGGTTIAALADSRGRRECEAPSSVRSSDRPSKCAHGETRPAPA